MLYAACQPFLIMMGAGNFIIPIYMNFYATQGYDPIFTLAWIVSDIAVCGAVLGYFFKAKDAKQKQLFVVGDLIKDYNLYLQQSHALF